MKNFEEFLAQNPLFEKVMEQKWDAPTTLDAYDNLKRLWRLGFLTDDEADKMSRAVRALYRKRAGLPRIEGDPEV